MAQVNKPTDYFNTKLYTGTGSQLAVTGVGFQPDFVWFKNRGTTNSHGLQDVVRGFNTTGIQSSNGADADPSFDGSTLGYVSSVGSDGFTVEAGGCANASGNNYVSWNWLANGTGVSNTDGSITSTVSANTTSGFSIVSYTGNGTSGATVGHGLGVAPAMIFVKNRSSANDWNGFHKSLTGTNGIFLNLTSATSASSTFWNNTNPTSSVFTIGNHVTVNTNTNNYIAYCFAEKKGFSKFGSYTGNGSTDGTFVYTGFKPAFVLTKWSGGSSSWYMYDNRRSDNDEGNPQDRYLRPNTTPGDGTDHPGYDFVSNGFKNRNGDPDLNVSGRNYIYMAIAEQPLVGTNNIPATAR
jgi:hypothetical protein